MHALHNRFHKIVLPNALSFFGGSRFVPIISTLVYMFVGIGMYFAWPVVQNGIYALGGLVTGSGYLGTLIFGIIKRALIPFGLHHVFYMPFWQTAVGGTMEVAGQMVQGGQNIFFAQLADSANIAHFSADATRYFSGEFIFMIFGLPGAALAMYRCAKPEKKKQAGGLLLSATLACMMTGITEPLEFSFLFVAPALFAVQVVLAGSAYMIAHILNIAVGLTTIPAIVRELSDDDAIVAMVDANIQREELLPSEKAFAYKMKLEAMKRQGVRTDLTLSQNETKLRSDEVLSKQVGESRAQVQRFVRLTELIPELLDLVDNKKLQFTVAVNISYIDKEVQGWIYEYISDTGFIKPKQIAALRNQLNDGPINQIQMLSIFNNCVMAKKVSRSLTFSEKKLTKYFPDDYTAKDMEQVIESLLEKWMQEQSC